VNKVSTAVQLRFDVAASRSLPGDVRERLRRLAGRRLTAEGVIIITAARFRTQARNREDARERLVELIRQAAAPPPKPRRPTKPTYGSTVRLRESKRRRSAVKAMRRGAREEE